MKFAVEWQLSCWVYPVWRTLFIFSSLAEAEPWHTHGSVPVRIREIQ
jgi:hypothetical protein